MLLGTQEETPKADCILAWPCRTVETPRCILVLLLPSASGMLDRWTAGAVAMARASLGPKYRCWMCRAWEHPWQWAPPHTPLGVLGWLWPEQVWDCSWRLNRRGTTNGWRQQWLQEAPMVAEPALSCSQKSQPSDIPESSGAGKDPPTQGSPARSGEREHSAAPQLCQLQGKGQRGHCRKSHPLTATDFQGCKQTLPSCRP